MTLATDGRCGRHDFILISHFTGKKMLKATAVRSLIRKCERLGSIILRCEYPVFHYFQLSDVKRAVRAQADTAIAASGLKNSDRRYLFAASSLRTLYSRLTYSTPYTQYSIVVYLFMNVCMHVYMYYINESL